MANIPPIQLYAYAGAAGFQGADLDTAVAIALAESAGNASAMGDQSLAPTNGPSYGLWQINVGSKAHPELAGANLYDPQTNANAAYAIYSAAGGFRPWSTYTSGAYQQFLNQLVPSPAAAPAGTVSAVPTFSTAALPAAAPLTLDAATGLPIVADAAATADSSTNFFTQSTLLPGIVPDVVVYGAGLVAGLWLLSEIL